MTWKRLFLSSSTAMVLGVLLASGGLTQVAEGRSYGAVQEGSGMCMVAAAAAYKARRAILRGGSKWLVVIEVAAVVVLFGVHSWAMRTDVWIKYPFEFLTIPAWGLFAWVGLWKKRMQLDSRDGQSSPRGE